jgi:tetratricopeptide (TPR) repeat protein
MNPLSESIREKKRTQAHPKPIDSMDAFLKNAYTLHQKGDEFFALGRFGKAKDYYKISMDAYRQAEDFQSLGLSLTRFGRATEMMGEYDKAQEAYEESLALFQRLSDLPGIARSKAHLGSLSWAIGNYPEATKFLEDALAFYRIGEDVAGEAWVHDLMGNLKLAMRDDREAERSYRAANFLVEQLGANLQNSAWDLYHFGAVALFRGEMEQAKDKFEEALESFTRLKDELGQVSTRIHLGEIACEHKDYDSAEEHFKKAVWLLLPTQCKPLLADALTGIAQLLKAKGDERKAISILMVALSHPTCRQQTKDRMVTLTLTLQSHLSRKEVEGGFKWAKAVSLDDVAGAWVASSSSKTKK